MSDGVTPRTSIIIPSLNSPLVAQVVEKIAAQDGFRNGDEVIVVGRDEAQVLGYGLPVRFIDTGSPVTPPVARNIGIDEAEGDLLIFIDSDCLPEAGWLEAHRAAHAAGHAVVGGSVLPTGENYWHLVYNLTMFHEVLSTAPPGERPFFPTLNLSVDRKVIETVGKLDATLKRSQDLDWTTRMLDAGFSPYFWPDAVVRHDHNRHSWREVWRDSAVSGQYARQVRLRHRHILKTPFFLRNRIVTLLISPLIALAVTARIVAHRPRTMMRHVGTWPGIYLSKIAWCWGASRQ